MFKTIIMKILPLLFILSLSGVLLSCEKEKLTGSGPVQTENRNPGNFNSIKVSGSSRVTITAGAGFSVAVTGYSNLLPYYESTVSGSVLRLGYRDGVNVKKDNIEVSITMPELRGLELSGSGEITTTGTFPAVSDFSAKISGSGHILFSQGTTQQFLSDISGSGNIYALGMVAQEADTRISGSGNTEITATNTLKATIAGSGKVYYQGTPVITTNISGSGAVLPK